MLDIRHLAEILGLHKVKGNSSRITACCAWPEHNDSNPSFNMWESNGVYNAKCFSCGRSANIVKLCKEVGNQAAFDYVVSALGLEQNNYSDNRPLVPKFTMGKSFNLKKARENMGKVVLTPQDNVIEAWLKTCPNYVLERMDFNNHSQQEVLGVLKDYCVGLDTKGYQINSPDFNASNKKYNMGKRAMFVVKDSKEKIVGWSGRRLDDNQKWLPKYFHMPGMRKDEHLYGEHMLNYNRSYVIVFEGFMSVLQWRLFDFDNVLSVNGSGMSDTQAHRLSKNFEFIVYVHDNDCHKKTDAGRQSAGIVRKKLGQKAVIVENSFMFPKGHRDYGEGKGPSDFTKLEAEHHMAQCEIEMRKLSI